MRIFELLNLQHLMLAVFPTLIFTILLALALGRSHFRRPESEERKQRIIYRYPDGIEDKNAPFPLVMTLIVAGTVAWAFFYILLHGLLGVRI